MFRSCCSSPLGSDDTIMPHSLLLKVAVFTFVFSDFQPCTVHEMSLSKNLSQEEVQSLRGLLRRAQETGMLSEFINPMEPEFSDWEEFDHVEEPASMNDASKRRCTGPEDVDYNHGKTRQEPIAPRALPPVQKQETTGRSQSEKQPGSKLPEDVTDIADWGSTIFKEGKLAGEKLTNAELAKSSDPEVTKYLQWLMKSVNERNRPQYRDRVEYLKATSYGATGSSGFVRERKSA